MQSTSWDRLQLPEKVEQLRHEFDELIRVEQHNVDARDVQRRSLETRMAAVEQVQGQILARLAALEKKLNDPVA